MGICNGIYYNIFLFEIIGMFFIFLMLLYVWWFLGCFRYCKNFVFDCVLKNEKLDGMF